MFEKEKSSSTLENVFFGAALVLFLVVGYFAAKRFGVIGGAASTAPEPPVRSAVRPGQPYRVGVDDQGPPGREIKGRDAGPAVSEVPVIKGAKLGRKRHKTSVPAPK